MGDCLVYYPGTVYLPDNSKTFISACVANGKGETLMEQIPYLSSGDKEIVQLSSDPSCSIVEEVTFIRLLMIRSTA